jgi:Asp-tRNA(Asn)/Glu-tRNA(Gln) amidotransferase A subunit family amidase
MRFEPASILSAVGRLRDGAVTLSEYLDELCDRIERREPETNALLSEPDRRGRLQRDAATLLARYPDPALRPRLFGIPVGVKDIIRADSFPTRAGSRLPADLLEGPEATCVTRLKQAGALILGKTVTTEFAYVEPGPTRNPHNPKHTPGGSSSGSAAAVAAGYCPLALGTQTVGSVIRPAAFCGVAGFKVSFGLVPLDGVIPFAPSVDHLGFMVQDASDLSPALAVLSDRAQAPAPRRVRLGIPEGPYLAQASEEARMAFEGCAR